MFVADTKVFTNSGWKKISDISGKDKVLVKNFIGDAEFIQPFALKKRQYDGEIVKFGSKDWNFSVTPEHNIVYFTKETPHLSSAGDMKAKIHHKIHRKFKYMFSDTPNREYVHIYNEFGKSTVTISDRDWYTIVGFVLTRGFIYRGQKRPMLWLFLEEANVEKEIALLGDIFDRIGLPWHVQHSEKTRPKFVVSSKNTLAYRLRTRLGSYTRKDMSLPDRMIYQSSRELTKLLIDTIIDTSIKPDTKRTDHYQLVTTNIDLIEDLELMGTLGGYSLRHKLKNKVGEPAFMGEIKKNSYVLHISSPVSSYTISYVKKLDYSGYVYALDLFDGEIYVKEGLSPIWVKPK